MTVRPYTIRLQAPENAKHGVADPVTVTLSNASVLGKPLKIAASPDVKRATIRIATKNATQETVDTDSGAAIPVTLPLASLVKGLRLMILSIVPAADESDCKDLVVQGATEAQHPGRDNNEDAIGIFLDHTADHVVGIELEAHASGWQIVGSQLESLGDNGNSAIVVVEPSE